MFLKLLPSLTRFVYDFSIYVTKSLLVTSDSHPRDITNIYLFAGHFV